MDKTPATLIDALASAFTPHPYDINAEIGQYNIRPGQPYLSGAHTITAEIGPFGVPYWMQGLAVQTCTNMYISAPEPPIASTITHSAQQTISAGQYAVGAAPTSGIFTGVEDTCNS